MNITEKAIHEESGERYINFNGEYLTQEEFNEIVNPTSVMGVFIPRKELARRRVLMEGATNDR